MLDLIARLLVSASLLGGASALPLLSPGASVAGLDAGQVVRAVHACPAVTGGSAPACTG